MTIQMTIKEITQEKLSKLKELVEMVKDNLPERMKRYDINIELNHVMHVTHASGLGANGTYLSIEPANNDENKHDIEAYKMKIILYLCKKEIHSRPINFLSRLERIACMEAHGIDAREDDSLKFEAELVMDILHQIGHIYFIDSMNKEYDVSMLEMLHSPQLSNEISCVLNRWYHSEISEYRERQKKVYQDMLSEPEVFADKFMYLQFPRIWKIVSKSL